MTTTRNDPVSIDYGGDGDTVGTVTLVDPSTVRITVNAASPDVFEEALDALSHTATPVANRDRALDVPVADVGTWLWWFAATNGRRWDWSDLAVERVRTRRRSAEDLDVALSTSPADQARWPDGIDLDALGVVRVLTDEQRRDVARMVALAGGANFSVPGAGKTTVAYVASSILRTQGRIRRTIVVAPLSAHEAWESEPAEVFATHARPDVVVRPDVAHGDVIVVNYEYLESAHRLEQLKTWASTEPTLVIFDEAHRAKAGRTGVRGRAALELAHAASHRCVLTGTPRPNGPRDLDNVLELAYPGRGRSLAGCSPQRLASAYCRTTKNELGLPPLIPSTQRVPLSVVHDRVYDAMVDAAARMVVNDPTIVNDLERVGRIVMLLLQAATDPTAALDLDGRLRMTGDRADLDLESLIRDLPASFIPTKFVRVAQIAEQHRTAGTKVLVWVCFKSHARRLAELLAPHHPAVVHGDVVPNDPMAQTDRAREIDRFRHDPSCTVLIATPHTLSEGISLHHTTTHQVHVDRTYNAGMFLQSLDRTHRLGLAPDAVCTATYLVAERSDRSDTIDRLVADRLEMKVSAMADVLNDTALRDLALPELDERLSPADVALGPTSATDLARLFDHFAAHLH
jgi:hypothetical protein